MPFLDCSHWSRTTMISHATDRAAPERSVGLCVNGSLNSAIGAVPPRHIKESIKHEEKSGAGDRFILTLDAGIGHTSHKAPWSALAN